MPANAPTEQLVKGARITDLESATKVNVRTLALSNPRAIAACMGAAYDTFAAKADH
jgi:hypothetical protein